MHRNFCQKPVIVTQWRNKKKKYWEHCYAELNFRKRIKYNGLSFKIQEEAWFYASHAFYFFQLRSYVTQYVTLTITFAFSVTLFTDIAVSQTLHILPVIVQNLNHFITKHLDPVVS